MPLPILIIGQGLAGTALAWRLWERGVQFLIVDRDEPGTSSKIAAGLLTPVTGMRLTLSENYGAWLLEAMKFYRHKEKLLGLKMLHPGRYVRLFKNDAEPAKWAKRVQQAEVLPFVRGNAVVDETVLANDRGGIELNHAGWLDTRAYLDASRAFFEQNGCWMRGEVQPDDVEVNADGVHWNDREFSHAALCSGWEAMRHPLFDWVPFEPARGTILTVRADIGAERRVIHGGCWVQPRGEGMLRVGSTYELKFDDPNGFDETKLAELHATMSSLIKVPCEVIEQQAAVRPIIARQRTLIGRHPARERLLFINGLGSKGVLRAPHFARKLVTHVLDGEPIPSAMDVRGNV
jgi:glycine/D-amino acid oxidase-like deaminating enzyme